jgi:FkbM family methyltransferase
MKKLKKIAKRDKWFLLKFQVWKAAFISRQKIGKKKLFIDGGSNLGQGYSFFSKYFPQNEYDVIFIEPNPNCMSVVKEKYSDIESARFLEKAIWIKEEKLNFFGLVEDHRGNTSTGGSVVDDHNSSKYISDKSQSISVNAFSFSDFLSEIKKDYNQIIVKMDIESAEYEVLKELIDKKTITKIDHLFVEFHSQYFKTSEQPTYRELEKKLIKTIRSKGVGVTRWI